MVLAIRMVKITACIWFAFMTEDFLTFSASVGNDLSTPAPHYGFDGLKDGDHWCLCVQRWKQAFEAGMAPKVKLESRTFRLWNL